MNTAAVRLDDIVVLETLLAQLRADDDRLGTLAAERTHNARRDHGYDPLAVATYAEYLRTQRRQVCAHRELVLVELTAALGRHHARTGGPDPGAHTRRGAQAALGPARTRARIAHPLLATASDEPRRLRRGRDRWLYVGGPLLVLSWGLTATALAVFRAATVPPPASWAWVPWLALVLTALATVVALAVGIRYARAIPAAEHAIADAASVREQTRDALIVAEADLAVLDDPPGGEHTLRLPRGTPWPTLVPPSAPSIPTR